MCVMVEGTDTGWLAVLEKKGLHQSAGILEDYGIDGETDVSLLDQGDLRNLVSQGLKPTQLLKCITDYKGVVSSQADGQEPAGFALVPETVQVIRTEFFQEILRADIELHQLERMKAVRIFNQLERMKAVRIFNPLHVLGNKISESDIDDPVKISKCTTSMVTQEER